MPSGTCTRKKEFQVEKNEPRLQINAANPIDIAEIRSVSMGALNAIPAVSKPTRLNKSRSTATLFSGDINLSARCINSASDVTHFKIRLLDKECIINSKISLGSG